MSSKAIALDVLQLPLRGLRLIEASAGTGKTWTIAALYVRLVLGHGDEGCGHGRPLLPPDILVVTFTEAATLELRERIRHRLYDAARCFRGQAEPDGFLRQLIAGCDAEQRLRNGLLLQLAADWMDEAAIYTIHGWCNRMLRQHAFDSGSLFKQELEAGDPQLLADVVRDYWRKFFYPLDGQQVAAVSQFAATPDKLLARVKALLDETEVSWHVGDEQQVIDVEHPPLPEQILGQWRDWERQRAGLEATARQTWSAHKTELESWLREASENKWLNGTNYPQKSFEKRLATIADWAEQGSACDSKYLSGFAQSRIKMNQKHQEKLLQHKAFAALEPLAEHLEQEPEIQIALSLHARQWIRRTYAERKQRMARLDYDDLLRHLDTALQGGNGRRLAEVIRGQYPVAMIDEFQDTDPLQYRIFHSVYRRDAEATAGLLLIGDPKQAIYAFRGADIHTYLQAKQHAQSQVYTLTRNFRSTQALVDAVNQLFLHAEQHPAGAFKFAADPQHNPLPFWPVDAQGRKEAFVHQQQSPPALTCWHWQAGDGNVAMADYLHTMAQATAAQIVELLNSAAEGNSGFRRDEQLQALQAADIAILVRNRREAGIVRQALGERGLRSVYLSDRDSVYASQEAIDILRWLRACAEPEQPRLLRAAMASKTLNLSLAQLDRFNSDELHWESQVELFKTLQTIWRKQGVLAMLRHLLSEFQLPQQLLAAASGERTLTNLLHLSELLQTASVELDGEQALIRHLADCIADGTQDDDSLLRLESDSDLIKVVTLHKSKGLEYPLVFLPFICSFREVTGKNQYYRYHDGEGRVHIDLGKADSSKQQADDERLQEDLRLLYVGLTRARHACWLGIAAVKVGSSDKCQLHKSAMGYLLAGGNSIQAGDLAGYLKAMADNCAEISIVESPLSEQRAASADGSGMQLAAARSYGRGSLQRWWVASYSALRLADEHAAGDVSVAPETARQANLGEPASDWISAAEPVLSALHDKHAFPRGSQAGVFLHGLLELAALTGFAKLAGDGELRTAMVATACERRGWQHWAPVVEQWLREILTLPLALPDVTVSLAELPRQQYQPELEFWFASRELDSLRLDALICRQLWPDQARPALQRQQLHGMMKGFADLLFECQGRYYLIDYKSNHLGADDAAYACAALSAAILQHRYDIQACLYLLALHRLLKARLGQAYDYERHIGGAVFWFIRGIAADTQGIQLLRSPQSLIEALDALFAGQELDDAA